MSTQRIAVVLLALLALAGIATTCAQERSRGPWPSEVFNPKPRANTAGKFDYYTMVMSWSPTHCVSAQEGRDEEQCAREDGLRYGFVLHGLWPQFERGGGPQDCATADGPDRSTIADAMAFMPSRRLIEHEWRAHGSCSGLDAKTYFDLADHAFAAVHVPTELDARAPPPRMTAEELGAAFIQANPGLRNDMFGVICRAADLAEVRVCVDTDLKFRSCGRDVRTRCPRNASLRIPSAR